MRGCIVHARGTSNWSGTKRRGKSMSATTTDDLTARSIRKESDSLGEVNVPADKLWGAQTQRSLEHFSIGKDLIPREMITAYATLKRAAANAGFREHAGSASRDFTVTFAIERCPTVKRHLYLLHSGMHELGLAPSALAKHLTIDLYGAGPTAAACSARRRKSFPRLRDVRRLKRNVNSSRLARRLRRGRTVGSLLPLCQRRQSRSANGSGGRGALPPR